MNFANIAKKQILAYRKAGRSIGECTGQLEIAEPLLAIYPATIHVLRICFEDKVPFSPSEIKRYCKLVYYTAMGGDPKAEGYFMTEAVFVKDCLKFAGKHQLKFLPIKYTSSPQKTMGNYEETNNLQPSTEGFSENPIKDTPLGVGGQK